MGFKNVSLNYARGECNCILQSVAGIGKDNIQSIMSMTKIRYEKTEYIHINIFLMRYRDLYISYVEYNIQIKSLLL